VCLHSVYTLPHRLPRALLTAPFIANELEIKLAAVDQTGETIELGCVLPALKQRFVLRSIASVPATSHGDARLNT
jgi:hypothetical protein